MINYILNFKNYIIMFVVFSALAFTYGKVQYTFGYKDGVAKQISEQKSLDDIIVSLKEQIDKSTAEALSNIQIVNKTIYSKAVKEIQHEKVYSDCIVPINGVRIANEALRESSDSKPVSNPKLP